ncbi:MAG: hypothetical protein QOG52_1580, partial [Frankiaceae bacterium]|nr:hypothetical protein [Frankiaceae bacterium]
MRLVGLLLLGLAVAATGTLLVALALDLGGRHAQISLSWFAQTAVYAIFAWQVLLLSRVTSLRPETRRFWRTLLITGACTTVSYLTGAVRSLTTPGHKGAATAALNAGIGAFGCAVLVYACLTFRRDVRTASTQLRRWIDAVTTMVAALGALWYVEAGSLVRSGASPVSIGLAIVVEALALVTVLALLQPTGTNARPISTRGGSIGVAAIAAAVIVEVLLPYSIDKSWLRLVLALRLITPALAATAIWLERVRPVLESDRAPRTRRRYTRGPYTAVVLIYVLLALALWFGGAARTWGMFAAACIVTTLVVVRQSMAFSDNDALVRELRQAVLSASELTEQLHQHAFFDSLTQLPNRALFSETLRHALAEAGSSEGLVGVIVVDLDDFKRVNDRAGHAAGDAVLQEAAARLRGCLRTADTVARLGGDEFAVVLADTDAGAVEAAAERIVAAFALPFVLADGDAVVGVSVGTALSSDSVADGDTLLRYADIAMYEAKTSGKSRHESFRAALLDQLMERHNSREALLHAIGHDEIVVVYQPIIASATHAVVAVEALARWQRPGRGLLAPDSFLPLAEEMGVISAIDLLVLRAACAQVRTWNQVQDRYGVHVNVSAITLARADLLEVVRAVIADTGIRPELLTLELTETALMTNPDAIIATMHELRSLGIRVAIDDFGTGYSSLAYLRDLPLDAVKMDRSFVERIASSEIDRELVRMIIALAETLGLDTVAEGVEHGYQAEFLESSGCRFMQGYLFSRAIIAADIPR